MTSLKMIYHDLIKCIAFKYQIFFVFFILPLTLIHLLQAYFQEFLRGVTSEQYFKTGMTYFFRETNGKHTALSHSCPEFQICIIKYTSTLNYSNTQTHTHIFPNVPALKHLHSLIFKRNRTSRISGLHISVNFVRLRLIN